MAAPLAITVTGATGFVGRHVVSALLAEGHAVCVVVRDPAKLASLPWRDRVNTVVADLHGNNFDAPRVLGRPDAVVHLAWPGLPNYRDDFHLDRNLPADWRWLRAMIETGLPRLLVTGTCLEYGFQSGALHEALPADPQNPYAAAKDLLRRRLEWLVRGRNCALQWARLFYLHGPGQNPRSLLAQLDRAIEHGDAEFPMSGGEQLRDYLPVEIAARRIARLVVLDHSSGIVNVCSGQPVSVRVLVERRIAECGAAIRPTPGVYPYPDYEPLAFWGDGRRYEALTR